jgi:hypothetical protein
MDQAMPDDYMERIEIRYHQARMQYPAEQENSATVSPLATSNALFCQ